MNAVEHRIDSAAPTARAGGIDRTKGVCRCWICRRAYPGVQERKWLTECLARDLLRKPDDQRETWLAGYALRHGPVITRHLRDTMSIEARKLAVPPAPAYRLHQINPSKAGR